ncbi:vWA domain-containing protein [Rhabdothermincola salaria]|uniref:vWA domain-containing protein n=1 Tax=Rhabdothermincola salaria TaxID=2903142 RepID=UPI001E38899D|nr:vWA domain-containing protein [Rhabdothermincola salaria]MCD9625260.1 VWA domain-containing protein [Rhabdothermincola salaria]
MRVRLALLAMVVTLLATAALTGTAPAQAQQQPAVPPALATLRSCLEQSNGTARLLALVVVDESGSLRDTDPDDQRVPGVRALLSGLAGLTSQQPGGNDLEVLVRVVTFAEGYQPLVPESADAEPAWNVLDETTFDQLSGQAGELADRDGGAFTDYLSALSGARRDLAIQSSELTADGGPPPCKLLVFFTDGRYDLALDADEAAGRQLLCADGGVTDGLRSDGVVTISVGLASGLDDGSLRFLEALTVGQAGGETCGTTGSEATGLFLTALNADDLFFQLGAIDPALFELFCPTPDSPQCDFAVPDGFNGFALRAQTPTQGTAFELTSPSGATVMVQPGDNRETKLADTEVRVRWFGDRQAEVTADESAGASIVGQWSLRFVTDGPPDPGAAGRIDVRLRADIVPGFRADPTLRAGERVNVEVGFERLDGSPIDASPVLAGSSITASLRNPETGDTEPLAVTGTDGRFETTIAIPEDFEGSSIEVVLEATVAPPDGTDVSVAGRTVTVDVLPPATYPSVSPVPLRLPGVRGSSATTGTLTIAGSDISDGCVWIEGGPVTLPAEAADAATEEVPILLSPAPPAESSCLPIPTGERRQVEITVEPTRSAAGVATGEVAVFLKSDASEEIRRVPVEVEFDMRPPLNELRRWVIFSLLMLLGVGIPIGVLVLTARRSTLLGPPQLLRWAAADVTWSIARGLEPSGDSPLVPDDFVVLDATSERKRGVPSVSVGQLQAQRRFGTTIWRAIAGLFAGGEATVSHPSGLPLVAGSPGLPLRSYPDEPSHQIPLAMASTWIFALRSITSDEDDTGEGPGTMHGSLTYIVADGAHFDTDAERLAVHAEERIAEAASQLTQRRPAVKRPGRRWGPTLSKSSTPDSDNAVIDDLGDDDPDLPIS